MQRRLSMNARLMSATVMPVRTSLSVSSPLVAGGLLSVECIAHLRPRHQRAGMPRALLGASRARRFPRFVRGEGRGTSRTSRAMKRAATILLTVVLAGCSFSVGSQSQNDTPDTISKIEVEDGVQGIHGNTIADKATIEKVRAWLNDHESGWQATVSLDKATPLL